MNDLVVVVSNDVHKTIISKTAEYIVVATFTTVVFIAYRSLMKPILPPIKARMNVILIVA